MKILIKGYFGFGNFGDDLLLLAIHGVVKEKFPTARIFIHSNNTRQNPQFASATIDNSYIHTLLRDDDLTLVDWRTREKFDYVINGGGGLYFDYSDGGFLTGVVNRIASVFPAQTLSRAESFARILSGKRTRQTFMKRYGLGIGIEPFHPNAPSYVRKKTDLATYHGIVVRDETSFRQLERFKYGGSAWSSTDNVFLSRYWLPGNVPVSVKPPSPSRVGIILMDWKNFDHVFSATQKAATVLKKQGMEVTYFSFDVNHDKDYIRYFQEGNERVILWQPDKIALGDFLKELASNHLLISARAHGAIAGGILGVPSICIGFREKLKTVHRMFERSSVVLNLPFSEQALLDTVAQVASRYPQLEASLAEDVLRNQALAQEGLDRFLAMIT